MVNNDSVKKLQHSLESLGFKLNKFGVDGKFGPETSYATQSLLDLIKSSENLRKIVGKVDLEIKDNTVSPEQQFIINKIADTEDLSNKIKEHFTELYKSGNVKSIFPDIVKIVIDNFEGGYFHPDMFNDGRLKDNPSYHYKKGQQAESGETMFGLDRVNGAYLYKNDAGKKFWQLIDDANARSEWKWNYRGGSLQSTLERLVTEIMYPEWERCSSKYLTPLSKKIIESDKRLLINFCYALWNGEGFFKKFARSFNESTSNGITNPDELVDIVVNDRTNSNVALIRQSGAKMKQLLSDIS
jgi:hypothetical protein